MTFKDHFSSISKGYSKHRPRYPDELYEFILKNVKERKNAWDCATGNGQAAIELAKYFDQVYATDASKAQIDQAIPHAKVKYSVAPAESSGLPSEHFDLITIAQALHWFDFNRFYEEVQRVASPNALIAAWSYGLLTTQNADLDEVILEFYDGIVGPYWPPERKYTQEKYETIPFAFEEMETPTFHMKLQHDLDSLVNYLNTWSAVKNYREELKRDPIPELRKKLSLNWKQEKIETKTPIYLKMGKVFK